MLCNANDKTNKNKITPWSSISNGSFILKGSTQKSGQGLNFINGYADYCIWGKLSENLKSTGYNFGQGLNKRVAKINMNKSTLRYKPGDYIFSGKIHTIIRSESGFILSGNRNMVFNKSNSWAISTFNNCTE